jgi:hypothetical protein
MLANADKGASATLYFGDHLLGYNSNASEPWMVDGTAGISDLIHWVSRVNSICNRSKLLKMMYISAVWPIGLFRKIVFRLATFRQYPEGR